MNYLASPSPANRPSLRNQVSMSWLRRSEVPSRAALQMVTLEWTGPKDHLVLWLRVRAALGGGVACYPDPSHQGVGIKEAACLLEG